MSASLVTRTVDVGVDDLVDAGFSQTEIESLSALRECYPFIEYVESAEHWRRMLFLKWRYNEGDLKRV